MTVLLLNASLLFHASFDRRLEADFSRGRSLPLEARGIEFRRGIKGEAVYVKPKGRLVYESEGNLNKARGSVEVWICPLFDGADQRWHPFFWEGVSWKDWEAKRNVIALWFWGEAGVARFDVRDPQDLYVVAPARDWRAGEWHHLVATWDCQRGTRLFIDGREFLPRRKMAFSWEPIRHPSFFVGSSPFGHPGEVLVDELRIYDAPLSPEEVLERYYEFAPLTLSLSPCLLRPSPKAKLTVRIVNRSKRGVKAKAVVKVVSPRGNVVASSRKALSLKPFGRSEWALAFSASLPGLYSVEAEFSGDMRLPRRSEVYVLPPLPPAPKELRLRKLLEVDLTQPLGPERFCDDGTSRVVRSEAGVYREAGPRRFSRFAVRFAIEHPGLPHLFVVHFPDDKERCAEVSTYSPHRLDRFNAHTGYLTGGEFPLSMRMRKLPLLVFPREREQGLVFTSWEAGKPVAVSKVEVYEIEGGLPESVPEGAQERLIGLYFEDPMLSYCFGSLKSSPDLEDFDRAARNLASYMRYAGLNVLFYPLVWYRGPLYDSEVEDVAKSVASNRHPSEGFVEILLERLNEVGAKFFGSIWIHSLPSVVEGAVRDEEAVRRGADTPLTVRRDGTLIKHTFHHRPPMLNPVHPKVRGQILRLVDEILRRFGSHPAFAGISLHLATPSPLWWGSLDVDYGDYTLILFEKETGIKVPVPPSDPERFSKRYEWLMKNVKERWIEWRCRKVYENLMEIARRVRERRKDLRLVLAVYPPVGYCGRTPDDAVAWLKFGRSVREYNRVVNGLDLAMFKNVEGVVLLKTLWPADYRFCKCFGDKPPRLLLSREVNFDPSVARWFHKPGACGINLHNRYFETAYGRKHPLKCLWWGPIGWRASAVLPEGRNFLELFAHGLSELDATILVTGGFTVGMVGREEVVREFASVFRRLPAVGWRNLPFLSDPVRGREWEDGEKHLLYFVNRLPYPLEVVLRFDRSARLLPMGSGEGVKAEGGEARLRLLPFQLRAFRVEPREARLTNGGVVPPASLVDELRSRFERLKTLLGEVKGADEDIKEALSEAGTALRSGKLFRARLLLYGYESARLEALAEGIQGSNLSSGR